MVCDKASAVRKNVGQSVAGRTSSLGSDPNVQAGFSRLPEEAAGYVQRRST